jgi:hypothetical protein
VAQYKPVFETLVRKDNPETQLDKLLILDQLLGTITPPQGDSQKTQTLDSSFHLDPQTKHLIDTKLAPLALPAGHHYTSKDLALLS